MKRKYSDYEHAQLILEYFFDIPLSMGDKVVLRHLIEQVSKDKNQIENYFSSSNFQVPHEATMRYINKF